MGDAEHFENTVKHVTIGGVVSSDDLLKPVVTGGDEAGPSGDEAVAVLTALPSVGGDDKKPTSRKAAAPLDQETFFPYSPSSSRSGSRSGSRSSSRSGSPVPSPRLSRAASASLTPVTPEPHASPAAVNKPMSSTNPPTPPLVPQEAVTQEAVTQKAVIQETKTDDAGHENHDDEDAASEDNQSVSEMGTASMIANGCIYTILSQMLVTSGEPKVGESKPNVADLLSRIGDSLERIAVSLEKTAASASSSQKGGGGHSSNHMRIPF